MIADASLTYDYILEKIKELETQAIGEFKKGLSLCEKKLTQYWSHYDDEAFMIATGKHSIL